MVDSMTVRTQYADPSDNILTISIHGRNEVAWIDSRGEAHLVPDITLDEAKNALLFLLKLAELRP